jgi:hypothetical protein
VKNSVLFNKVAKHLLKQNAKSISGPDGDCLYHGPNKLRCAVGCLIPFSFDTSDIEGMDVASLSAHCDMEQFGVTDDNIDLLNPLQNIHDNYKPSLWRNKLKKLAKEQEIEWKL